MYCSEAGSAARGRHDDGVVHRAGVGERLHDLRDRRAFLPNAAVNANNVAALLIDDGVKDDSGLAGLAVADDQLALAAADGNHGVNGLDTGLQRLAHRLAIEHAGSDAFERVALLRNDGTFSVQRLTERIHHAADQRLAHRHGHNRVRALDDVAFFQFRRLAEQHDADFFLFEVERDTENIVRESEHLAGHDFFQAMDARDAVADADNRADFVDRNGLLVVLDLLAQNLADFVCLDVRHACSVARRLFRYSAREHARAFHSSGLRNEPS